MKRALVVLFGLAMFVLGMALRPVESASQQRKKITIEWSSAKQDITFQPIKTGADDKSDWATCNPPTVTVGIHLDGKGGGKLACAKLVLSTNQ